MAGQGGAGQAGQGLGKGVYEADYVMRINRFSIDASEPREKNHKAKNVIKLYTTCFLKTRST